MNIVIIGASPDIKKMSNKAVHAYDDRGDSVFPINPKEEEILGLPCYASIKDVDVDIDKVLMYVHPEVGMKLIEDIAKAEPGEIIFNPGSESDELIAKAKELGLSPRMTCSIRDIGVDPDELIGHD